MIKPYEVIDSTNELGPRPKYPVSAPRSKQPGQEKKQYGRSKVPSAAATSSKGCNPNVRIERMMT